MPRVHVSLAHRSYDIEIGHGLLEKAAARCRDWLGLQEPGTALVVTDANLTGSHAPAVTGSLRDSGWQVGEQPRCLSTDRLRDEACYAGQPGWFLECGKCGSWGGQFRT